MPARRKYDSHRERQAAYRARQKAAHQELLDTKGRHSLGAIPTIPGYRRWQAMTVAALAILETARREMAEYYEDRSESWQDSEPGESFLERTEALEEIIDSLESLPVTTPKTKENTSAY